MFWKRLLLVSQSHTFDYLAEAHRVKYAMSCSVEDAVTSLLFSSKTGQTKESFNTNKDKTQILASACCDDWGSVII